MKKLIFLEAIGESNKMNRIKCMLVVSLGLALPTGVVAEETAGDARQGGTTAPNIVLILADDMAWSDVGYNGQKNFETPHIDQMAADGMRFDDAYAGTSVCSPSRACLITGMYSPRHHIYHPGARARDNMNAYCLRS
tara:strand:+ start:445 stop:855 length:411 start_codon:yes stop_codon:yes gene_type:complete